MAALTLYRCVAAVRDMDEPEVHVFFEAASQADAAARISRLLACVWGVPIDDVDVYNVVSEHELIAEWSAGPAATGDARLLESGWSAGETTYCEAARCVALVRPAAQRRLMAAWQSLAGLPNAAATRPLGKRQALSFA